MSGIFVTEDELAIFKESYEQWKRGGFADIDRSLPAVIEKLNAIPGVVTISSCEGHPSTLRRPQLPFYLRFLATASGYQELLVFFDRVVRRSIDACNAREAASITHSATIAPRQIYHRDLSFSLQRRELILPDGGSQTFPTVTLGAKGTHVTTLRDGFVRALLLELDNHLKSHTTQPA